MPGSARTWTNRSVTARRCYKRILQYDDDKKKKEAAQPSSPLLDSLEESKPIYVAENGKRMRKQQTAVPVSSNLFKACIHGDQTVVTGNAVKDASAGGRDRSRHEDTGQHPLLRGGYLGSQPAGCGGE